jgi:hypothetical protein
MPQYQGVWTLEQQAQAQSNQQWVTDPNFKNTTLLLQADGTGSGSQNQTFLDGSTNNFFITRNGNTTQGSFSPFSQAPGYWGNYFNGSSYLTVPNNTALELNSVAFTIEAWVYLPSVATAQLIIGKRSTDGGTSYPISYLLTNQAGGVFKFETYGSGVTNSTTLTSAAGVIQANVWNHVAVTGDGTNIAAYVNGVRVVSPTASTLNTSTSLLYLGNFPVDNPWLTGYISNARILKGTQLYSGATYTVPTSPLTAITNTVFLTSQSNRFVDNSTNAFAISVGAGTPSVQAFGPFAPALQWTPDVVGGSGYFDGTGDYLAVPSSSAFSLTGDFTYDGWVYVTNTSTARYIMPSTVSMNLDVVVATGNNMKLQFFDGSTATTDAINTFPINTWAHIAVVRSGTSTNNCSFYVNGVRGTQFTTNVTNSSPSIDIGRYSAGGNFYGYMGSLRIVNGQAVYSGATYTVPNAPLTTTGYGTTSQSITASNTKLLLNYTNAGIYDGKMGNVLETVGSAQVATSPVKYGSGSMYFDGNGDYLTSASTQSVVFGTGDFTVEMWVFPSTVSAVGYLYDTRTVNTNPGIQWYINSNATMGVGVGTTSVLTTAAVMTANEWQHIAVAKANGVWSIYRNGVLLTSATNTTAITDTGFVIACSFNQKAATTTDKYAGYIDDFRITKACRYFTTFTPPQQALPRQ